MLTSLTIFQALFQDYHKMVEMPCLRIIHLMNIFEEAAVSNRAGAQGI